ncbi:mercury transporter [Kitasatospora sp. NPDC093558]|uniref:mercury transporter n=1 Tax=Kitasatospora sp. NPDC093558 TaxID=3155201 RepID=UPI00341AC8C2
MPAPAADQPTARTPKTLGALAALACVACCALPALIAAGVVGAGAGVVVGWLPALAAALAVLAAGTWWAGRRRATRGCGNSSCGTGGCGCQKSEDPLQINPVARR